MCSKALFLRKKSTGLNSIEELAYSLVSRISGLKVITLPEHGNTGDMFGKMIRQNEPEPFSNKSL